MYDVILFATDGTDFSLRARPHVERLALALNAHVVVVSALEAPPTIALAGERVAGLVHSERLGQVHAELVANGVRTVQTRLVEGPAAPAILKVAEEVGSDLIVMATHGRSGLERVVVGSVAEDVVRGAERISVVLVRPDEAELPVDDGVEDADVRVPPSDSEPGSP